MKLAERTFLLHPVCVCVCVCVCQLMRLALNDDVVKMERGSTWRFRASAAAATLTAAGWYGITQYLRSRKQRAAAPAASLARTQPPIHSAYGQLSRSSST